MKEILRQIDAGEISLTLSGKAEIVEKLEEIEKDLAFEASSGKVVQVGLAIVIFVPMLVNLLEAALV